MLTKDKVISIQLLNNSHSYVAILNLERFKKLLDIENVDGKFYVNNKASDIITNFTNISIELIDDLLNHLEININNKTAIEVQSKAAKPLPDDIKNNLVNIRKGFENSIDGIDLLLSHPINRSVRETFELYVNCISKCEDSVKIIKNYFDDNNLMLTTALDNKICFISNAPYNLKRVAEFVNLESLYKEDLADHAYWNRNATLGSLFSAVSINYFNSSGIVPCMLLGAVSGCLYNMLLNDVDLNKLFYLNALGVTSLSFLNTNYLIPTLLNTGLDKLTNICITNILIFGAVGYANYNLNKPEKSQLNSLLTF